jgi:hypothetical protein
VFEVLRRPAGALAVRGYQHELRWADYATLGVLDPASLPTWTYPTGFIPLAAAAFDPDGDGFDDLLLCGAQDGVTGLRVFTGPDDDPPLLAVVPFPCAALEVADFDGDGAPEIAVGGGSRVVVVEPADGSFASVWIGDIDPGTDGLGTALDAADVNGDGRMDLFAG